MKLIRKCKLSDKYVRVRVGTVYWKFMRAWLGAGYTLVVQISMED